MGRITTFIDTLVPWLAAIGILLLVAVTAIGLGTRDVLWPVSTPAEIVGAFFIVAGLVALGAALVVAARLVPFSRKWSSGDVKTAFIAGGGVAGLYVAITIVVHSFHYEPVKAWGYGVLAAGSLVLVLRTLPTAWRGIGNYIKGAGISVALLGSAAGFYFQSFYLPENTHVGLQYEISIGNVIKPGADEIVPVDLSVENQSSVIALTLGSIVIASEVTLPESSSALPDTSAPPGASAQQNLANYAHDMATPPPGATAPDPNVRSSGTQSSEILAVLQPIGDNSYLFPNDVISRHFDVVIPQVAKNKITAIEIEFHLLYARTTRLVLGSGFHPTVDDFCLQKGSLSSCCAHDEQSSWNIDQSALVTFTRGRQLLYSNFCVDLPSPSISWTVQGPRGAPDSPAVREAVMSNIDVEIENRNDMFVLP